MAHYEVYLRLAVSCSRLSFRRRGCLHETLTCTGHRRPQNSLGKIFAYRKVNQATCSRLHRYTGMPLVGFGDPYFGQAELCSLSHNFSLYLPLSSLSLSCTERVRDPSVHPSRVVCCIQHEDGRFICNFSSRSHREPFFLPFSRHPPPDSIRDDGIPPERSLSKLPGRFRPLRTRHLSSVLPPRRAQVRLPSIQLLQLHSKRLSRP